MWTQVLTRQPVTTIPCTLSLWRTNTRQGDSLQHCQSHRAFKKRKCVLTEKSVDFSISSPSCRTMTFQLPSCCFSEIRSSLEHYLRSSRNHQLLCLWMSVPDSKYLTDFRCVFLMAKSLFCLPAWTDSKRHSFEEDGSKKPNSLHMSVAPYLVRIWSTRIQGLPSHTFHGT